VTGTIQPPDQRWLDTEGTPITVGAVVEQIGMDIEAGALRSRQNKQGQVVRRSATRLVVCFQGESRLARIQPELLRVVDS
jgi:hypothetical protein